MDSIINTPEYARSLIEASLDPMVTINADGKIMDLNGAMAKITNKERDNILGTDFNNFFTDPEKAREVYQQVFANGFVTNYPLTIIDGVLTDVLFNGSVFKNKHGKVLGAVMVARNVTEKTRLNNAFIIERQQFNDLFSEAPFSQGVLSGPDHRFEMANPMYFQLIGQKDIIGKCVKDVLPEVEVQGFIEILDHVYQTGKTFSAKEMIIKIDVNNTGIPVDRYLNFIYQAHRDDQNEINGILFFAIDVTEQVLSRKKIELSYKEFQFVTDFMPQLIWVTKPDGYHSYYNKRWYNYTGLAPHETEGEGWNHVFHPDDQDRAWGLWRHSLETGEPYEIEYRCRRYDGEYRWFLGRALPLKDSTGSILKWFGTCTDIDDQKRATESLRKSEERYRQIVDTAQEGIWLIDEYNKTTFVNSKMGEILGYGVNEMMGKDLFDFMDEKGIEIARVNVEKKKQGHSGQHKFKFVSKAGNEVWTNLADNPLFNEDGSYSGALAMVTDITLSQKAEEKIIESEKEIRTMAESMPQIVWTTDAQGQNTYFNQQWVDYTGLTLEESYGDGWLIPFHKDDKPLAWSAWNSAVINLVEYTVECRLRKYDGSYRWWLMRGVPKINEKGEIEKWFGTCTDIENIKQTEENLQKQAKELVLSNAELEQFAYTASHDLQEPLRMVISFLTQLEKKYGNVIDNKGKKYIGYAVDGAKRMRQIILDLLEFSQVGMKEDQLEHLKLNDLLNEVILLLRKNIEEKSATISMDQLPEIRSHRTPLRQVFQNLISNALKYSNKENPPQIKITVKEFNDHWKFAVIDNGIGIENEYFEKIFILFHKLHNNGEYSGTGMGLAITKKIIGILGGEIWVESEIGKGSSFYFTIKKQQP